MRICATFLLMLCLFLLGCEPQADRPSESETPTVTEPEASSKPETPAEFEAQEPVEPQTQEPAEPATKRPAEPETPTKSAADQTRSLLHTMLRRA